MWRKFAQSGHPASKFNLCSFLVGGASIFGLAQNKIYKKEFMEHELVE
jgi:hypothetical protein